MRAHTHKTKKREPVGDNGLLCVLSCLFTRRGRHSGFFSWGLPQFHQMNKRSGKEIKQKPEPKKKKEENDNNNNKTGRKQNKGATTNVGQENNRA